MILDSSKSTTLGHTTKPPQKNGHHTVLLDCFKGISPLCDQIKIQMQTKQYFIRPKAQPENTHIEITKPAQKSVQNIVLPMLLYPPCMQSVILNTNGSILDLSKSTT